MFYLGTSCELSQIADYDNLDWAATIIGASCHDYEHPGYNNQYLVETCHDFALKYNGKEICPISIRLVGS
jgi:hypothetical protein